MDFAGPLLPSIFHRFTCYACVVDAGSGYGRLYPAHHMTATVATAALDAFTAEMGAHMGFHGTFKPFIVRSDQGSAFVSHYFREFMM
jgi:transposase InsO family protein